MSVSPLDHATHEDFLSALYHQKITQIDDWEAETGKPAPPELWDEANELAQSLRRRFRRADMWRQHAEQTDVMSGNQFEIAFELICKQFKKGS